MQEGVCDLVCFASDVQDFLKISVVLSVEIGEAAEVGASTIRCEGTFLVA